MIMFICMEHPECSTEMTWEEYTDQPVDSPHTWISVGSRPTLEQERAANRMARESDACWNHRVSQPGCPNCL